MATPYTSQTTRSAADRRFEAPASGRPLTPTHFEQLAAPPLRMLSNGLALFSFGLGFVQIAMPDKLARFIGLRPTMQTTTIMRLIGLREIGAGMGIITQRRPNGWLKARVAGDLMDLALLGKAKSQTRRWSGKQQVLLAMLAVAGVTALDILASRMLDAEEQI